MKLLVLLCIGIVPIFAHSIRKIKSEEWDNKNRGSEDVISLEQIRAAPDVYTSIVLTGRQNGIELSDNKHVNKLRGITEATCSVCLTLAKLVSKLLEKKTSDKIITAIVQETCIITKKYPKLICEQAMGEWGPDFFYLADRSLFTPADLCHEIFDSCGDPIFPTTNWTITLPTTPRPPYHPPPSPPAPPGAPTLRVLHLTDIHVDRWYLTGARTDCGFPLCCRAVNGQGGKGDSAGTNGSYAACDIPPSSLENLFRKLSQEKFDVVLFTGDIPAHDVYNQTVESQLEVIDYIQSLFLAHFPSTPVLHAMGNHEANPVDQFIAPYSGPGGGVDPMAWLYGDLVSKWGHWVNGTEAQKTIEKGAYYSHNLYPNLKVISLNSCYGSSMDWFQRYNNTDATGQLQWFVGEMAEAEARGAKVWLIMHHPNVDLPDWSREFLRVVQRFSGSIAGVFYGHTHSDSFRVYYDPTIPRDGKDTPTPVAVGFVAPAVTGYQGNSGVNFGYRVYTIDGVRNGSTYAVLDHETFILNLTAANLDPATPWTREYSMRDSFNMTSLSPAAFDDLLQTRMQRNLTLAGLHQHYFTKATFPLANATQAAAKALIPEYSIMLPDVPYMKQTGNGL